MRILKNINRQWLTEHILLVLLFVGGANLFIFLKTSGVEQVRFSFSQERPVDILKAYVRVSISGAVIALFILIYESYLHPYFTRNFSFLKKRIVWQVDIALIITLPIGVVFTVAEMIDEGYAFTKAISNTFDFLLSGLFISYFIYYYILSSLISFLRRLRMTFGQYVFYNYITGKYAKPTEEDRVFMFIDLNNSTQIAEEIGHVKYSRLLNRCFDDIIISLRGFKYDIYQFVGDEMVLTWLAKDDNDGKAIRMFECIRRQMELFEEVNKFSFGVQPTFKASVSSGMVTATLVGDKSKNVAYHGDVLNTTARLLGLCKSYKQDILFTHFYRRRLIKPLNFKSYHIDTLKLKGKSNNTKVYALKKTKQKEVVTSAGKL